MKISDAQIRRLIQEPQIVAEIQDMDLELEVSPRPEDRPMIDRLVKQVLEMPDREDMIAELKARINGGEYNPTGDEIVDCMIRRAIADRATG